MIDSNKINWVEYQSSLIPQIPPHKMIPPPPEEIKRMVRDTNTFFARWVDNWDCEEKSLFWAVIKDQFDGMEELSSNTRSKVRRGLKNCSVEPIEKKFVKENGYRVYLNAFNRYDNYLLPSNENEFVKSIDNLDENWEFWGVFDKKNNSNLIAYSQNWIYEKTAEYKIIKFDPDYLNLYPSYALFFEMNKHYLEKMKFNYVNDGYRSVAHQSNIQEFLIQKFKFRKAYCKLNLYYSPITRFIVKMLFPFKPLIDMFNVRLIKKVKTLLFLELINRSPI